MPEFDASFSLMLQAAGLLAGVFALWAGWALWSLRRQGVPLRPVYRPWSISWNGWAVVSTFVASQFFSILCFSVLLSSGFFRSLYGPEFDELLRSTNSDKTLEQQAASSLAMVWASVLSFPITLLAILFLLKLASPTVPLRLGWSAWSGRQTLVWGYVAWLICTPITFSIFVGSNWITEWLFDQTPEKHPLTLLQLHGEPRTWLLFILRSLLIAPILEEVLFRGILLPWLMQPTKPKGADSFWWTNHSFRVWVVALLFVLSLQSNELLEAIRTEDANQIGYRASPFLFILGLFPVLLVVPRWRWLGRRLRIPSKRIGQALIASSILFAAVHSSVWPSPIPLFFLSLGLGYITYRTRHIAPAILMHALFNAVSVVYLLLGGEK